MPTVKMPDGTLVEMPETLTPEQAAALEKIGTANSLTGKALAYGKSALRGPVLGAAWMLDHGPLGSGGGTIDPEKPTMFSERPEGPPANLAGPLTAGDKVRGWLNSVLPPEPGMSHRIAEGVGGGAVSRFPIRGAVAGGVGTASAEGANQFLAGFPEPIRQAGTAIAGMLGGGGAAALMAPRRQTTPMQDAERDTRILTDVGMNRVGSQVDPSRVANETSDAANRFLRETRGRNSDAYTQIVDGQGVQPRQVAMIYSTLRQIGDRQQSPAAAAAYYEVADSLIRHDPSGRQGFITDVQTLSGQMKRFKDNPVTDAASSARKWTSQDIAAPVQEAEGLLRSISPAYEAANNTYAWGRRNLVDPVQEGPIGKMADRNPNVAAPTPVSRMEGLIQNRGEGDIVSTMLGLRATGASPQEIARALMQARNRSGGPRPGEAIFGAEGSPMSGEMNALLASGGMDPARVQAPFRAADLAADAAKIPQGERTFATGQLVPRPGISIRGLVKPEWFSGNPEKRQYTQNITELLRTASPQEVQQLIQLAQFDPKIRLALTMSGIAIPQAIEAGK